MSTEDHPDWWRPVGGSNAQDSTLERRSLVWNDDDIEDGTVPDAFYEEEAGIGKFYTRGCRGMLEQLQVYCTGDGLGVMTLRYSPHPGIGPFGEVFLTPAAGWAWQAVDVELMWNYDSLFVWVHACGVNVDWAYDAVQPHDGHEDILVARRWADLPVRPFIRAVMTGETPGDVPVSGIVNTISIPNTATEIAIAILLATVSGAWTVGVTNYGAGKLIQVEVRWDVVVVPAAGVEYRLRLSADGAVAIDIGNRQVTQSIVATAGRCSMGEFLQTATHTYLWVRLPLEYRRSLALTVYQSSGGPAAVLAPMYSNELT